MTKRILSLCLTLVLVLNLTPLTARADLYWPAQPEIQADSGILMDSDTGAVLYEKNINQPYYPASITKILTALIVIEQCDLDETVVFSHDAVYNVESGSSNAGLDEGDQLTVRDCLYALLLSSANESANALAEHVSGSREAFAQLMNEKAASLGCTGSHFANPSGLNDENHYTTAHDMALITQAAIHNPVFVEICGSWSYRLPPTKHYPASEFPNGRLITSHHQMLNPNNAAYYPGAFCGKTGYTSLAGNTLVTCAQRNDMTLIAVVLNGHLTHYEDTRTMFNFGFDSFQSLEIRSYETRVQALANNLSIAGMTSLDEISLSVPAGSRITLPKNSSFDEAEASVSYDLDNSAPAGALARIDYTFMDRPVGQAYLCLPAAQLQSRQPAAAAGEEEAKPSAPSPQSSVSEPPSQEPSFSFPFSLKTVAAAALMLLAAGGAAGVILLRRRRRRQEEADHIRRHQRRQERLKDIGYSSSEFDRIMDQYRSSTLSSYSPGSRRRKFHRRSRHFFRRK